MIFKSELNSANKKWISELKKLDTKTRKFLTMHKMHHPKSDADRLYVARKNGGRCLTQLETSNKIATNGLSTFLKSSEDPLVGLVRGHDAKKKLYSVQKETQKFFWEFDLTELPKETHELATCYAKRTKHKTRQQAKQKLSARWTRHFMGDTPKEWKMQM